MPYVMPAPGEKPATITGPTSSSHAEHLEKELQQFLEALVMFELDFGKIA